MIHSYALQVQAENYGEEVTEYRSGGAVEEVCVPMPEGEENDKDEDKDKDDDGDGEEDDESTPDAEVNGEAVLYCNDNNPT